MSQIDEVVKQAIQPIGFIERLLQESKDLNEKLDSLNNFIGGTIYNKLDNIDKDNLLEQNKIMKNLQMVLAKRIARNLIKYSYPSTANLPDTPEWNDTNWDLELKRAIKENYSYIATPEGYYYRIDSEDKVTGITMMTVSHTKEIKSVFEQLPEEVKIKKLASPSITPEYIESLIKREQYHIVSERLTICILTLENGFEVTGESSCLTEEKFDKQMGETVSRNVAKQKIWQLEGYLLKQKIYEGF